MTDTPKTTEEAWELFNTRRFLHGHRESDKASFAFVVDAMLQPSTDVVETAAAPSRAAAEQAALRRSLERFVTWMQNPTGQPDRASGADDDRKDGQATAVTKNSTTISGNVALAAEYLALNVLNCGELPYAKQAIETALMHERIRCLRIVEKHFPKTDARAVFAVVEIADGADA